MRLIDADALKENTEIISYQNMWYETEIDEFVSVENIDNAPTIEIVRCKECKYYAEHNELYINAPTNCVKHSTINHYVAVNADDFCSYGEREGE